MSYKKILFISPTGTFDNGAEISIYYLMKHLVENGHSVLNVAPQYHHGEQAKYYERFKKMGVHTHFIPALKWWWEDAPNGMPGSATDRAVFYRDNIGEIRKIIKENDIDLVITNTVNMFQGAVAAACEKLPHYWLIHEFPTKEFHYYLDKVDFIDEMSDKIYSVNGELNLSLRPLFPQRTLGVFSPFTQMDKSLLKKGEKQRIVSVGRLTARKNQLELIKAYQKLNRPELELVFIGAWDKDYKHICQEYIDSNKIKNVIFKGNLENPWQEVTDKDICVFPSALETYGLVYVEAILKGVPTILSDNPGHRSAFELFEFGELYPTGDIDILVEKIARMLTDFEAQKNASVAYQPLAFEKYSIAEVYGEILNDIETEYHLKPKAIRHLENLVSTNERYSRLALMEKRARRLYHKVKARLLK